MDDRREIAENIIRRFREGDAAAFEIIYRHTSARVHRFIICRLPRDVKSEAHDLMQEVYLRAWKGAAAFRVQCAIETWLCGIARFVILHRRRRRLLECSYRESLARCPPSDLESPVDLTVLIQDIRGLAAQLPPKQRQAYQLIHIDGLSIAEAAIQCKCDIPLLRARLRDARAHLRGMLNSSI